MKVRAKELDEKARIATLDALYTAAGTVRGRDAMKLFLRDLLTESERIMLGRRILIAQKLLSGETHRNIGTSLGVGYDTIQRIEHWLEDQMPGYEKAIVGLEKEMKTREMKRRYASSGMERLRMKYPGHFLLFSLLSSKQKRAR